ncbi:hypothetical protein [Lysobacter capsici]|uniref:hypothetical protein n=1 Tax=Lysobacter capsici TaxID=435897 RepID=UPI00287B8BA0|nr:hypothetical protein [Lysobacter capsici]WND81313.1 hypothetical protein RJ610_02740 [Lysobacter capsici]WND86509.1 hypothetical protein RJ609_02740 [Lysobacter capsici]
MTTTPFLQNIARNYDLIAVEVLEVLPEQRLRIRIERIYANRHCGALLQLQKDMEIVHIPPVFGVHVLHTGERGLMFVSPINGILYEEPARGHFVIDQIDGMSYAGFKTHSDLHELPEALSAASRRDHPRGPAFAAIELKALEDYLVGLYAQTSPREKLSKER